MCNYNNDAKSILFEIQNMEGKVMCKLIKVVKVKALDNYHVLVKFEDGIIKDYDCSSLIKLKCAAALKDVNFFKERCCVINDTLAWRLTEFPDEYNCIDLDPRRIYKEGITVEDNYKWQ